MKKLILLFAILAVGVAQAQYTYQPAFGISLGFSTETALSFDVVVPRGEDRFHFGFSAEVGTDVYPEKRSPTGNFGRGYQGEADQFWTIDLGYSREVFKNITINPELSIGQQSYYDNYSDRRFTEGGYSHKYDSEGLFGGGLNIGYKLNKWEPFIGYNTIKGVNFGARIFL